MHDEWTPDRMKRLLEWQRRQVREKAEALATMEQRIFHRGFSAGLALAMTATALAALVYFLQTRGRDAPSRRR